MKKTILALFLVYLILPSAAFPQQTGIVEGRLVNMTDASIIPGNVELEVLEMATGMGIIKSGKTDGSGKFRVEGLPSGQPLMIRANYKGVSYNIQTAITAGKAEAELVVYEPTTSMKDIHVDSASMAFQFSGDHLSSLETIVIHNNTGPPRTFSSPEGNFRISKAPGLLEPPTLQVTAPGSSMPLRQSMLESADGKSYYSLYPLRPGTTQFEVQQLLPYKDKRYTYAKRFYQDVAGFNIGVIPQDMVLSGTGLSKIQTDSQKNICVYASPPITAGTEVVWEFSGGTPVSEQKPSAAEEGPEVVPVPTDVERNAVGIGSLILLGLVLILWYAYSQSQKDSGNAPDYRLKQIRQRREQLLKAVADLDQRYEAQSLDQKEYLKQREEAKRQLRRISLLLK